MEAPRSMTTRKTYSHHYQHIAQDESVSTPRHYIPTTMTMPHSSQYLTPVGSPLPTNYTLDGAYPQQSSQGHAQNGYLDSFPGLDVLGMTMDPNTHAGAEFDILSVHEQPRAPQMLERPRRTRRETYDATKAAAEQKEASPPGRRRQRRARSADSSVEGETPASNANGRPTSPKKQKRGRPRLDTKDENAADRRRTQIRLAQRAYRQRKETTISSLRSRVDRLEDALNEVQSTFFELYTAAMATYVSKGERQTAWLKDLGARVSNLTRSALSGAEGEIQEDTTDEHPGCDGSPRSNNSNNNNEHSLGGHQWTPHGLFADAPQDNSTTQGIYESVPQTNFADHSIEIYPSLQHQQTIPLPSGAEPFAYYFQETKFARRLQRAVYEHGYWLLTNPAAPQSEIARRFAFTFCYATLDDVLKTLTIVLKGPPNERSLCPKDYPELAKIPPRALNCYDDILSAYHDKARLETIEAVNPSIRSEAYKQLIKLGVNSEFLGPEEVELLLVDMGVLPAIDSTVAVLNATPGSPTHTEEMSTDNNSVDSFFPTPHLTPSASEHNGTQNSMQAAKKLIDLDLLVRVLAKRAVCLGQHAGFKRQDVDEAIAIASQKPQTSA